jgi:N-omega-hydroxy-L-arginine synthase
MERDMSSSSPNPAAQGRRPGETGEIGTEPRLVSQALLERDGASWHRAVLEDLRARVGDDPDFPCLFSKNAFRKRLLKFVFVETIEADGMRRLADGLADYVEISRDWNGSLGTAYPLVVAFSLDAIGAGSLEAYHAFGWTVLQRLHELDPAPWPRDVGRDPDAPSWSMCFNGMPLFCNMSHPAHPARRSRNLGRHFLFIINPRERFDVVAGDTPSGRRVRSNIRERIHRYDGISHCPQLASYGAGGIEWWQYGLADENVERADRCPFRMSEP